MGFRSADRPFGPGEETMASIASYFQLKKRGTTVGTEVRAGATTFLVMAYIIFVNANYVGAGADRKSTRLNSSHT